MIDLTRVVHVVNYRRSSEGICDIAAQLKDMLSQFAVSALFFGCLSVLVLWTDCDFFLRVLPYSPADKSFSNQIIWIIGASSGIGASLAEELTLGGAQVVLSARRMNHLEDVADKCALVGHRPMIIPFDVLDFSEHEKSYQLIIEKFGRIDVLVLNAGRSQRAIAMNTQLIDTRALMELNFMTFVSLTKIAVPAMSSRESGGQIVVLSSLAGKIGTPISSSYSATKFALHGYFDALRAEISFKNVNIQIVCPGPVESEISIKAIRGENTKVSTEEKRMPTARCTHLMARGMKWRLDEIWISNQPYLALTYLHTYMPFISRQLFKRLIGPGRVKTLAAGGDIYSLKNVFGGN